MEPVIIEGTTQTSRASKACSRIAKPSPSSYTSSSTSSWGLSGRVGMRVGVLRHRDLITCRFFHSLPRSWLKKYWGRLRLRSNKRPFASLSSFALRWSSSPFSLSRRRVSPPSPRLPSVHLSHLSSPALKDRDRERDQVGPASTLTLEGHSGFLSAPGMTISQWGPNTQLTAAHSTSSTAAPATSLGQSLCHHSSSG